MSEDKQDLGHKRTCPHCGVKYYDFYQDELDCPECGKSIEAVISPSLKEGEKLVLVFQRLLLRQIKKTMNSKILLMRLMIVQFLLKKTQIILQKISA